MDEVTLKDLVGEHVLSGCDMLSHNTYANGIVFILDSVTYQAEEDPCDDYRSCLGTLGIVTTPVKNIFEGVRVRGRLTHTDGAVLELMDVATEKVVLEVGTGDNDDYYPYFVARFTPENMVANQ